MDDYKRKYEEALGRARTFSQKWQGIEATDSELALQELKEIFPELKESEDERIKEDLIQWINEFPDVIWRGHNTKDVIAWLEKQGLQKQRKEWDADDLLNYNQIMHILQDCNQTELMDWLEKQGEQKIIVDNNKTMLNACINILRNVGHSHLAAWLEKQGDQKLLNNDKYQTVSVEILDRLYESEKELERLKQDEGLCKKSVWTSYDEKAYEIALLDIDKSPSITKNDTIDWLKSLKEKYAWKPSDEQMEALLKLEGMHVLEHEKNQENAHLYMVIKSLKEQLLKLKGE